MVIEIWNNYSGNTIINIYFSQIKSNIILIHNIMHLKCMLPERLKYWLLLKYMIGI